MAKTTSKTGVTSALDFLGRPEKYTVAGVVAIFGDEAFLKREVLITLRRTVLGTDDGEFSYSSFLGRDAQLREVLDALATVSLFSGGPRVVVVEEADPFVSNYRAELETYVAKPARGSVLVLEVKTWPSNTRLAKAVADGGMAIECKAPDPRSAKRWLGERAKKVHGVALDSAAVEALWELLPPELGILDQEVAKLALLVDSGSGATIDLKLVRNHVGGWRTRTAWDMVDAVAEGRAADALKQLDRLIAAGEKPHGLLPQMSSSLRKLATAGRLVLESERDRRKMPISAALKDAGLPPFRIADGERQLRQIGRERARRITEWLLAADLAIKGHNSSDARARTEIERLIVRLSSAVESGARMRR